MLPAETKDSVKYLGYVLTSDLSTTACESRVICKEAFAMISIRRPFRKISNVLVLTYVRIVKSLVLSTLSFFNVFLESANTRNELTENSARLAPHRVFYRQALRYTIGVPKNTHICALHLLADAPSLSEWISAQCAIH